MKNATLKWFSRFYAEIVNRYMNLDGHKALESSVCFAFRLLE